MTSLTGCCTLLHTVWKRPHQNIQSRWRLKQHRQVSSIWHERSYAEQRQLITFEGYVVVILISFWRLGESRKKYHLYLDYINSKNFFLKIVIYWSYFWLTSKIEKSKVNLPLIFKSLKVSFNETFWHSSQPCVHLKFSAWKTKKRTRNLCTAFCLPSNMVRILSGNPI